MKRAHAPALCLVVAASLLLLAGCATGTGSGGAPTSPAPQKPKDASGEVCLDEGAASKAIEVEGDVGDDLELTSKTPVEASAAQRSVLIKGRGELLEIGETFATTTTVFSGADGDAIEQSAESELTLETEGMWGWAYDAARCAVPGQRVAMVVPVPEFTGGTDPEDMGLDDLTDDDAVVIVIDFKRSSMPATLGSSDLLKRATGEALPAPPGFPTVTLAEDGEPTITIPPGVDAPTSLQIATLIQGDGEIVKPDDRVYVHYRGVLWRTGEEFDASWTNGLRAEFRTEGMIGGFEQAIVGQAVGSQVISVVPAGDGGYGAATLIQKGFQSDDVMVFVIDILGTAHAN